MQLRLAKLADIDPLSVPLPHGTEVTTRVDRLVGEQRIPQGAVGRVVGTRGDLFEVRVVGVGVACYARHELVPRKLGQLRFAQRRQEAWHALAPCVVLEAVVGSRAWGLATETSDTDRRGFFALPFSWTTGLVEPPLDLVSADASTTYWELGKAIRQAMAADPNTLEALFVDTVQVSDELGQWILDERDAFVSAEIYGSFGRYALSQLQRLEQSARLAEHRALVLAWMRDEPAQTLDQVAARLAEAARIAAPTPADAHLRAKEYIKQLYRSLYDQGLIEQRELAALAALARTGSADLELPRELRPKNAYNLLRLIDTAIQWLRTGHVDLRVKPPMRDRLLAIKRGEVPMAEILADAEQLTPELEAARKETRLPLRANAERADRLLRRIREEVARRHITRTPGPLGADAPELPLARWEE